MLIVYKVSFIRLTLGLAVPHKSDQTIQLSFGIARQIFSLSGCSKFSNVTRVKLYSFKTSARTSIKSKHCLSEIGYYKGGTKIWRLKATCYVDIHQKYKYSLSILNNKKCLGKILILALLLQKLGFRYADLFATQMTLFTHLQCATISYIMQIANEKK